MNKKGFTLVELLAVIVILAIIALIAVPIILNVIDSARKGAAESSAYGFVNAIEYKNMKANMTEGENKITSDSDLSTINTSIDLKGTKPTILYNITIEKDKVIDMSICINGYRVNYNENKAKATVKCEEEEPEILDAEQIEYTNSKSKVKNVQEALDELYGGNV